jgi:hypothetical protein
MKLQCRRELIIPPSPILIAAGHIVLIGSDGGDAPDGVLAAIAAMEPVSKYTG